MVDLTGHMSLVTPVKTYHDYFARADMDTLSGSYDFFLHLHHIEKINYATTVGSK